MDIDDRRAIVQNLRERAEFLQRTHEFGGAMSAYRQAFELAKPLPLSDAERTQVITGFTAFLRLVMGLPEPSSTTVSGQR